MNLMELLENDNRDIDRVDSADFVEVRVAAEGTRYVKLQQPVPHPLRRT